MGGRDLEYATTEREEMAADVPKERVEGVKKALGDAGFPNVEVKEDASGRVVYVIRQVPKDRVGFAEGVFKSAGATEVTVKEEPPGSGDFTVTATF
jgi:hypothetical protein